MAWWRVDWANCAGGHFDNFGSGASNDDFRWIPKQPKQPSAHLSLRLTRLADSGGGEMDNATTSIAAIDDVGRYSIQQQTSAQDAWQYWTTERLSGLLNRFANLSSSQHSQSIDATALAERLALVLRDNQVRGANPNDTKAARVAHLNNFVCRTRPVMYVCGAANTHRDQVLEAIGAGGNSSHEGVAATDSNAKLAQVLNGDQRSRLAQIRPVYRSIVVRPIGKLALSVAFKPFVPPA